MSTIRPLVTLVLKVKLFSVIVKFCVSFNPFLVAQQLFRPVCFFLKYIDLLTFPCLVTQLESVLVPWFSHVVVSYCHSLCRSVALSLFGGEGKNGQVCLFNRKTVYRYIVT